MAGPTWRHEDEARRAGGRLIAGLDEVGRGCLAGPVIAAAVILDRSDSIRGIDDSKALPAPRREALAREILARAVDVGLGCATAAEVDRINVLQATLMAMRRAIAALEVQPDWLLLDAVRLPGAGVPQVGLVHGDRRSVSIAAASIVAKVVRDGIMSHYSEAYPAFEFAANKGYGTPAHLRALKSSGPCPIHRLTFRRVSAEQPALAFES